MLVQAPQQHVEHMKSFSFLVDSHLPGSRTGMCLQSAACNLRRCDEIFSKSCKITRLIQYKLCTLIKSCSTCSWIPRLIIAVHKEHRSTDCSILRIYSTVLEITATWKFTRKKHNVAYAVTIKSFLKVGFSFKTPLTRKDEQISI